VRLRELVLIVCLAVCVGCNSTFNGWLDPTQVGRFREKSVTMDLRRSVSVADEPTTEIEASEPTAEDLQVDYKDYILRPGDVIDISVFELMVPGQPWVEYRQISGSGYITVPQVKQDILVAGKSAREIEKYLEKILQEEQVLTQPEVTIMVREARNMTFNVLGAVSQPRSDIIPRPNFRILDALAVSGGTNPPGGPKQPLVKMVYVFRNSSQKSAGKDQVPTSASPVQSPACPPRQMHFAAVGTGGTGEESGHWVYTNGEWKFIRESGKEGSPPEAIEAQKEVQPQPQPQIQPSLEKQTTKRRPSATKPAEIHVGPPSTGPCGEGWEEVAARRYSQRVIAIPLDKLEIGDPRYNVVVRDGDTVWVPPPLQGEFYVMGNVLRPGVYSLTGREITIRQAMSAAGGLGALADPSRCELVRRIGGNQEQTVALNIDRIFAGKEADIILKPDDIINVGSNAAMPFLAVIRNAFRLTYGFGFVYDRNFADIDSFSSKENPANYRRVLRQQRFGL
jgi:polysaccharide biosynthesis/export protein